MKTDLEELEQLLILLKKHRVYSFCQEGLKVEFSPSALVPLEDEEPETNPKPTAQSDDEDMYWSAR